MRLPDRVAIITGSAAGIGRETALTFAREGAKVVVCDMAEERGQAVVAEIQAMGREAMFVKVNVAERPSTDALAQAALDRFGRIDILVNNAGITRDGIFVKFKDGDVTGMMSEADFDAVIGVNLKGVFNCTQSCVPAMLKQGAGVILSASSVVGVYGNFGQTNYAASKAGVIGMTKVWARELGPRGIRANAVAPGFILTDMTAKMPEKILQGMVEKTPVRRAGLPADIANAYLFLASDEASFINGTVIMVDGGLIS
jgi:3-oxoacyl-[acyl-carrier protein] reductase